MGRLGASPAARRPSAAAEAGRLCDAVAALTLTALSIPAERLSSALGAVHNYNRSWFGIPANDANYPTLRERREIVKRFSAAHGSRGQPTHAASADPTPPE